jgi:replicative DNA helicase
MTDTKAHYQIAAHMIAGWRDDLFTGKAPVLYPIGQGDLGRIEIGPGLVTLIGGAPGAGKTAFTMQAAVDALRITQDLRACVCNVEMSPGVLLDRQLARLSGIDLNTIRHRKLTAEHADRLDQALNTVEPVAERLCFVRPPYDLKNVAASADAFGANLILLDYVQRIAPPGEFGDRRGSVDATMNYLRQFADNGVAVVVVSAVARTKDQKGRSSYNGSGLNLASFRESSELEFGADDAFILVPAGDSAVTLKHLKARHTAPKDVVLHFDCKRQRFIATEMQGGARPDNGELTSALAALWDRTEAASDEDAGEVAE